MRDKIGTKTNNRNQTTTTTTTVETEGTITFSKAETGTGTTMGCVRKTSRKKHPERKEIRKKKKQQKETDRIIDRIVMAMDCGTEFEESNEKSGTSTTNVSNEDESSAAEAHKLLIDHLQYKIEFQEAGKEEASTHDDDYGDSGTNTYLPLLVGR